VRSLDLPPAMDQPPAKEPRGPVSLRIKFRSANLDQFIERYAVDVSRGGIFIRTREPLPVGTQMRFDFQLQDATPLLAGEGTIVWIRENDPSRAGVTPGMGVRFDKLTASSQPTLEKILAEKARREQAGAPAKTGPAGGMAVRRPSSTFSALDPAAARAAQAASGPPRVGGLSPLGGQPRPTGPATGAAPLGAQPRSTAPTTGSGPLGAQPRTTAPAPGSGPLGAQPRTTAPAVSSDPFGTRAPATSVHTSRTAETAVPAGIATLESSGAFGRPRSTTGMNTQRPAPAPSALFEKPTADDIDRALSVLTEVDGPAPAPVAAPAPADFSSRVRRPTDAQPMVLESAPDVGDAPSRRSGTRPLFSGTGEMKVPTVPVIPVGGPPGVPINDHLNDEEEEDDATSAWINSGPTRVGGSPTEPEMPAASSIPELPKAAAPPASKPPSPPSLPAIPPPGIPLDAPPRGVPASRAAAPAEAPRIMAPAFPTEPPKKKGSGAGIAIVIVLLAAVGGGGYYAIKLQGKSQVGGATPAPATTAAPEGTATPAPEGAMPGAAQAAAPDAGAAPSAAAEGAKTAAADKPTTGGAATPSTLRARPEGEAAPTDKEAAREAKPSEAKPSEAKPSEPGDTKAAEAKPAPDEAKPSEAKHESKGGHRGKRRASAETSAAAEAKSAVADVSPTPTPADAPAPPSGEGSAKAAGGGHVLKITSAPAGAEVIVDGSSMGTTPFSSGDVDPALPHSITIKKDGFEAYEHMIGGSDWPRAKNGVRTLKLNAKLRGVGGEAAKPEGEAPAADTPAPGLGTTPASPKRE
jgi:uncharacterized protein (TIGR02266 family)